MKELQLQYDVQVDVVTQLEGRVKQQLNSAQSSAPQIVKLKRDFERVQARVQSLKLDVERLERLAKSSGGAGYAGVSSSSSAQNQDFAASQQQVQLQMQQDVRAGIVFAFSNDVHLSSFVPDCCLIVSQIPYPNEYLANTETFRRNYERTRGGN